MWPLKNKLSGLWIFVRIICAISLLLLCWRPWRTVWSYRTVSLTDRLELVPLAFPSITWIYLRRNLMFSPTPLLTMQSKFTVVERALHFYTSKKTSELYVDPGRLSYICMPTIGRIEHLALIPGNFQGPLKLTKCDDGYTPAKNVSIHQSWASPGPKGRYYSRYTEWSSTFETSNPGNKARLSIACADKWECWGNAQSGRKSHSKKSNHHLIFFWVRLPLEL